MSLISNLIRALANLQRRLRHRRPCYVVLGLSGTFSERARKQRRRFPLSWLPWPAPPPSLEALSLNLERLASDHRVLGVVFQVSGLTVGPATALSLRQAVERFRASGKQAVFYLTQTSFWPYVVASAGDRVIAPESCTFQAAGLWVEAVFLKDTLGLAGIKADFEAIAEYKVSPDTFRRSTMSEPHRDMLESILDSTHDTAIRTLASGRGLDPETLRSSLDSAPMSADDALSAGLLDAIAYEDELPALLGSAQAPITLVNWESAQRWLLHRSRRRTRQSIGVVSVEGVIVEGASRPSPLPIPIPMSLPAAQAGSHTIIQQLRAAARNKRLAAMILHIDSPGGSALASDLIWREVERVASTKPVVVYMGDRAASGGYYIAAPAQAIVAQPTTLTGSIGIWGGKFVTQGLYQRLGAHREVFARGQAAGLLADTAEFSDEERDRIRRDLGLGYRRFKHRVAQGRSLDEPQVEAIARGRVWTGAQALDIGLVDVLGDFATAIKQAKALARLDMEKHTPVVPVMTPRASQLPLMLSQTALEYLTSIRSLLGEGTLALAPWEIRIQG